MNKQDCVMLIDDDFVKVCEVDFPDILSRTFTNHVEEIMGNFESPCPLS